MKKCSIHGCALFLMSMVPCLWAQGPIEPLTGPAPLMKTLEQMEPRTIIPSLPYSIDKSGSYYLAGHLTLTETNVNALDITANHVVVDMNGFTITGPGTDSGSAIRQDADYCNLTVKNGTIKGFRYRYAWGISAFGHGNRYLNLTVAENNGGISAGSGSVIENCVIVSNASMADGIGIMAGDGSVVSRCAVSGNSASEIDPYLGIYAGKGCSIENCAVVDNRAGSYLNGIQVGAGATVRGCSVADNYGLNGGQGFEAGPGATVVDCSSMSNTDSMGAFMGFLADAGATIDRCTSIQNAGPGIWAKAGCTVRDCVVQANGTHGIVLSNDCLAVGNNCTYNGTATDYGAGIEVYGQGCRIEDNNMVYNDYGIQALPPNNLIIRNSSRWNNFGAGDYDIADGNNYGEIIGSLGTNFVVSNPWANLRY
ncbi:MAG: hypothetical protein V2A34_00750 [Lentisphaerota bacterium]